MRLLDACARKPVDATPVWLMRQAGRYLPEYRAIREKMSFVEMCRRPDIAAEVTLQPLRRFELDAERVLTDTTAEPCTRTCSVVTMTTTVSRGFSSAIATFTASRSSGVTRYRSVPLNC